MLILCGTPGVSELSVLLLSPIIHTHIPASSTDLTIIASLGNTPKEQNNSQKRSWVTD